MKHGNVAVAESENKAGKRGYRNLEAQIFPHANKKYWTVFTTQEILDSS